MPFAVAGTDMNYSIVDKQLEINGKKIPGVPVYQALLVNDILIVVRDWSEPTPDREENVFGFDRHGEVLWQLKNPDPKTLRCASSVFMRDGKLLVYFTSGYEYYLDARTGLATELGDSQRPW